MCGGLLHSIHRRAGRRKGHRSAARYPARFMHMDSNGAKGQEQAHLPGIAVFAWGATVGGTDMNAAATRMLLAVVACAAVCGAQNAFPLTDRPSVQVSGSAELSVAPDRARISMSVSEIGENVSEAKQAVDNQTRAVQSMLRRLGVADTAIEAAGLRVHRRRLGRPPPRPEDERDDSVVYYVAREVVVTVDRIDSLDEILDRSIALGVDEIREVALFASAADSLRREAMRLAADDAKETARALAAQFGRMLGPLFTAVYDFAGGHVVRPVAMEGRGGGTEFATGLVTIRAQVSAVFELEQ
ncbi:MAG: DUF541 domain-containing protein [Chitinivibrionales bacterium]|nr:DUF541 domain-containing protein [Chitinivibrionales bacterium]